MKGKRWRKALAVLFAFALCFGDVGGYVYVKAADNEPEEAPTFKEVSGNNLDNIANDLAKALVGSNMEVKNAKFTGNIKSAGQFAGAYKTVGFDEGIVLSTGFVKHGEKSIFEQGYKTMASDGTTKSGKVDSNNPAIAEFVKERDYYDLTMLEFTVVPKSDSLSFQYAVASEEYIHWLEYCDQFVLSVNGQNYALIPDKKDSSGNAEAVTIGSVNPLQNSEYYRGIVKDIEKDDQTDDENAISLNHFVYNGITKVFSVDAPVLKGQENKIKLAIADNRDEVWDSAVFIKAGSVQDKQALYGLIDIAYVDSESKDIYLRRKGGYNSAVSVDVVIKDDKGVVETKTVEFPDGSYMNIVKAPNSALYAELANPTGAVQIAEDTKVDIDNWISASALKEMSTKVTGVIEEEKDGKEIPVENAQVIYKSADGEVHKAAKKTNAQGEYTIYNVPGGKHNIFVTNQDGTKEAVEFTEITIFDINQGGKKADPIILNKKVSMNITSSDSLSVVIGGLDKAAAGNTIKAEVSAVDMATVNNDVKKVIESGLESLGGNLEYVLDINLTADGTKKTELDKPILVTVKIPKQVNNKNDYYLYHVHNNGTEVEILYDLDNDPDTITVKIDKLSEFALMSKDTSAEKYKTDAAIQAEQKMEQKISEQVNAAVEANKNNSANTDKPDKDNNTTDQNNNNQSNTNNNQNSSNSSSSSSSSSSSEGSHINVTQQLREKVFEGVKVETNKVLYKGDIDIIEINGVLETTVPITYTSKDPKTVTIDKDGNVKAEKAGKTTIVTEITKEGISKKYETTVTVKKPCIEIVSGKAKLKKGKTTTFKAQVYGSDAKVTWSVSNKKVATIDKNTGKLKAKSSGTVTVYAKAGSLKKAYKVKIVK